MARASDSGGRQFVSVVLLTAAVTFVALFFVVREGLRERRHLADERRARAVLAMDEVRDALRETGRSPAVRQTAFAAWSAEPKSDVRTVAGVSSVPSGSFVWQAETGIVWQAGCTADVLRRYGARRHWKEWARAGRNKAPQRDLDVPADGASAAYVLWGRVDEALYAWVFAEAPVAVPSHVWIWPFASVFVLLTAGAIVTVAGLLRRDAVRARRDDARKTRFVADVSHELKTPLAAIGLWADLLSGGRLSAPERRAHALEVIVEEKNRLIRLVESLLNFTRLEEGRRVFASVPVDVGALARAAAELVAGDFTAHGLTVAADDGCVARADADAVREILLNLLGNAAKYAAADGPVTVRVARAEGQIAVTVADRGPGLPPAVRERIFARFYRREDDRTQAKGGFGLGLPIARGLARGMGGDLTAESPAGGATFLLTLPAAKS